jgi:hypothetical protein
LPRYKRSGHSLVVAGLREGEDAEWTRKRDAHLSKLRSAYEANLTGTVPKLGFPYQEGVFLKLEQFEGRWWCGFEPFTFVDVPRDALPPRAPNDSGEFERPAFNSVNAGRRSSTSIGQVSLMLGRRC